MGNTRHKPIPVTFSWIGGSEYCLRHPPLLLLTTPDDFSEYRIFKATREAHVLISFRGHSVDHQTDKVMGTQWTVQPSMDPDLPEEVAKLSAVQFRS